MTRRDDEWGTPRPTPDDGPEHAFDAAWRAAEREDEMAQRRDRADSRRARSAQERITAARSCCLACGHGIPVDGTHCRVCLDSGERFDESAASEAERAWVEALGVDPVEVP